MCLVSVIIPVYNTEKYLRECVDSIVNQTYTNLEIVLVNDGSTDSCPAICDEYARQDSRIVVIHKPNGGRSDARNTGLSAANGEYILFVDSDDYIERNAVSLLVDAQKYSCADMVIFNFYGKLSKPFPRDWDYCNGEEAVSRIFKHIAYVSPCTRFCHKDIYKDIVFPVGLNFEDTYKSAEIILNAKKIFTIDNSLYFYRDDVETSITGAKINVKQMDCFYAYENLYKIITSNNFKSCIGPVAQEILYFFVSKYGAFKPVTDYEKEIKSRLAVKFKEYKSLMWKHSSLVNKVAIILFTISPSLAHYIFKFYRYLIKEVFNR